MGEGGENLDNILDRGSERKVMYLLNCYTSSPYQLNRGFFPGLRERRGTPSRLVCAWKDLICTTASYLIFSP